MSKSLNNAAILAALVAALAVGGASGASWRVGYLTFASSLYDLPNEKNIFNWSIGQELLFTPEYGDKDYGIYYYSGANYEWGGSGRSLNLYGTVAPLEYQWDNKNGETRHINLGAGATFSYNFSKKYYGIGPQVDLFGGIEHITKLSLTYRYNINFGANNAHELELRFSFIDALDVGCRRPRHLRDDYKCPDFVCGSTNDSAVINPLDMVFAEGGAFTMGCTEEDKKDCEYGGATPAHKVILSDFYIGRYEVTQWLWKLVMGSNPTYLLQELHDNLPVTDMTWNHTQIFIDKLNQMTGMQYRLPTEAEWEYAARGGNKSKGYRYSGSDSLGEVAIADNYVCDKLCIGAKAPNELGIYDMSGNVEEWVNDWHENYTADTQIDPKGPQSEKYGNHYGDRVYRGGRANRDEGLCRVYARDFLEPNRRFGRTDYMGFRLAHDAPRGGAAALLPEENKDSNNVTASLPEENKDSNNVTASLPKEDTVTQNAMSRSLEAAARRVLANRGAGAYKPLPESPPDASSNPDSIAMVFVEGGTFMMGCTPGHVHCDPENNPQKGVSVGSFYMSKYEVTQGLWRWVMGRYGKGRFNPSYLDNLPVEEVSWHDVRRFIRKLNRKTGKKYRLPTEAEWEYAARGGNKSNNYEFSGSNVIDNVAWYRENSNGIHDVGTRQGNELGIHDMTGNVNEWVDGRVKTSHFAPDAPRIRGGDYSDRATYSHVVTNSHNRANGFRSSGLGFRLAIDP